MSELKDVTSEIIAVVNNSAVAYDNYVGIIEHGIMFMRKYNFLSGLQKKTLLIEAISEVLKITNSETEIRQMHIGISDKMIDTMVYLAKNKIQMNVKTTTCCY